MREREGGARGVIDGRRLLRTEVLDSLSIFGRYYQEPLFFAPFRQQLMGWLGVGGGKGAEVASNGSPTVDLEGYPALLPTDIVVHGEHVR